MTDKTTILVSWMLLILFIAVSFWKLEAGMVIGFLAYLLRWEDIRNADKAIKTTKDKFLIGFGVYWVVLAAIFAVMKLTGFLPVDSDRQVKILLVLMFLPLLPRLMKHDFQKWHEAEPE